ncbi:MAG: hypothetical protein IT379_39425 [Deltaproteobacteria bacterium]|nr:hypothetical protein [Deltaproteobacteria bacterium]
MTLASILSADDKRPGTFLQVTLGVGATSAADAPRLVLLCGNKTAAGTATVATRYAVTSEDDARTLFGAGSELLLGCQAAFAVWPGVPLYAIAVAESGGTAATGVLAASGTATADGTIDVSYCGQTINVPIASGTTAANVAVALEAALEDMTDWPLDKGTAMAAAANCTVTFIHKGPRGNRASLRVVSNTPGITITGPATGYLTGGATPDNSQNALDAVAALRHHYIVAASDGEGASATPDTADLTRYRTHVNTYAGPDHGKRQVVIFGFGGTLADATTVATGMNAARMQCVWQKKPEQLPLQIAAAAAALRARHESSDPGVNLDDLIVSGIAPSYSPADWPTGANLKSALNNGITPLRVSAGEQLLTRSITTRSQDAAANPSYSVLDTTKVTVPDFVADDFAVGVPAEFGAHGTTPGFKAGADDPDGDPPPDGVVTPLMLKDWMYARLLGHEAAGLLEPGSVELRKSEIVVELAPAPAGRFNCSVPLDVIEGAHQFAIDVRQVA